MITKNQIIDKLLLEMLATQNDDLILTVSISHGEGFCYEKDFCELYDTDVDTKCDPYTGSSDNNLCWTAVDNLYGSLGCSDYFGEHALQAMGITGTSVLWKRLNKAYLEYLNS